MGTLLMCEEVMLKKEKWKKRGEEGDPKNVLKKEKKGSSLKGRPTKHESRYPRER